MLQTATNASSALDGLNLTVSPGEIFCLLGQNGAEYPQETKNF
ncbi:hypothetical protein [Spirosoma sp. KUDC1026]|nr:hypothetical protein [Spirosoma sp. KUDC1026]